MHLMTAQQGQVDFGDEAVDLNQTPADIVILTSTDTEILGLARAWAALERLLVKSDRFNGQEARQEKDLEPLSSSIKSEKALGGTENTLRLANLTRLRHNYSVDLYAEKTLAHAKLVIVRLLGGEGYWPYGVEEICRVARAHDIPVAFMPGCANPDDALISRSTLPEPLVRFIWQRLVEGGRDNYIQCLKLLKAINTQGAAQTLGQLDKFVGEVLPSVGYWDWQKHICLSLSQVRAYPSKMEPFYAGKQAEKQRDGVHLSSSKKLIPLIFYRALVNADDLEPIKALAEALDRKGLTPLPLFVTSPKDKSCQSALQALFKTCPPLLVITITAFNHGPLGEAVKGGFCGTQVPMIQAILATRSREAWLEDPRGLTPRELAMYVALPEVDGRINGGVISFKTETAWDEVTQTSLVAHKSAPDLIDALTEQVLAWALLAECPREARKLAFILSRYPGHDGGIAHGVGLDSPASLVVIQDYLKAEGYRINNAFASADEVFKQLQRLDQGVDGLRLSLADYLTLKKGLPESLLAETERVWGDVRNDPAFDPADETLRLPLAQCGAHLVGLQPERSGLSTRDTYHDLGLPPPHAYLAFYLYLANIAGIHALIHLGKHGTLEWLPGKANALSQACTPKALLGAVPLIYPFIVNDPGEGCQAKRRNGAVIIDHLTPPLRQSETYDDLAELERLVDEYYEASGTDPRRIDVLSRAIIELAQSTGLAGDCNLTDDEAASSALQKIDNFLCDLKALQIRDGLHCFGRAPKPEARAALLMAFCRAPRGFGEGAQNSLLRALAEDLKLTDYDPLAPLDLTPWQGKKPDILRDQSKSPWYHDGHTRERLEQLGFKLITGEVAVSPDWPATLAVFDDIHRNIIPALEASPDQELKALISALDGRFVPPGPSGAPTRGRIDVLPTGRNFYALDTRTVPTPAAFRLGKASAERLVELYRQEHGEWPKRIGLTAWGTANMRTGGDDIATALALIGVQPTWDRGSFRLTGFDVVSLADLGRPRVDIVMRLSGFFRDAFPEQMSLLNSALDAVAARHEPVEANPLKHNRAERLPRLYTNKQGAYGGGLKARTLEDNWDTKKDLAESFIDAGGYAVEADGRITPAQDHLRTLLSGVDALSLTQDSREFDLLDSDDFFDFEGGFAAAANQSGANPALYHGDSALGDKPDFRSLKAEIGMIVRGRAANPVWIKGMKAHGARGAFEMVRSVHALYGFAATTNAVTSSHFDALFRAYVSDEPTRQFIEESNPEAYRGLLRRFAMAYRRGFWQTRSNSALALLDEQGDNHK